ncbi:MAG: hypothetical protein LBM72_02695 [Mycoplasmataceae bacterium]|nr:hypothetical protein [Mycoplasmataceae bacterium]
MNKMKIVNAEENKNLIGDVLSYITPAKTKKPTLRDLVEQLTIDVKRIDNKLDRVIQLNSLKS